MRAQNIIEAALELLIVPSSLSFILLYTNILTDLELQY